MYKHEYYLFLDCESIGLYGETFAFGFVLTDSKGQVLEEVYADCDYRYANYLNEEDLIWIQDNVIPNLPKQEPTVVNPFELRALFWSLWITYKDKFKDLVLVADCGYPVETSFVQQCVKDQVIFNNNPGAMWQGPYPFYDSSNLLAAIGINPTSKMSRNLSELPEHNPLKDARQTKRLFFECLSKLESSKDCIK